MYKKQLCLFKWDCVINYNGNGAENKKMDHIDTT